ncbi:MAG: MEKHLA domain-containing protein [Verrucomicrobia bacterium]|nr:MEKHLA domain-containing protein [Verrucomicrobiota bacterium]
MPHLMPKPDAGPSGRQPSPESHRSLSREHRNPRIPHNPWTAWLVLALSLFATVWAWRISSRQKDREAGEQFASNVEKVKAAIVTRLDTYEMAILAGRSLFMTSQSVNREQWRQFVASMDIDRRFPGLHGLSRVQRVSRENLKAFEQTARMEIPGFVVHPQGDRNEYFIVKFNEPMSRNAASVGYDSGTKPVNLAAFRRACETGLPTATAKMRLVQEPGNQAGFVVILLIYRPGLPVQTAEQRFAAADGWVGAVFRAGDFFRSIPGCNPSCLDFRIFDGASMNRESLLYDNRAGNAAAKARPAFEQTTSLDVFGRKWTVHFATTTVFDKRIDRAHSMLVLIAGSAISILIFSIAWSLSATRKKALALAEGMTSKVREHERAIEAAQERLRFVMTTTPAVLYTAKASGDYGATFISDNVTAVLGYEPREFTVHSSFWLEHVHPDDRPKILAEIPRAFQQGFHSHEYRFRHKDGGYRWLFDEFRVVRDANGAPLELVGSCSDITEQKRAEEMAHEKEARLRFMVERMPAIFWSTDAELRVTSSIGGGLDALNMKPDQTVGMRMTDLLGTSDPAFEPLAAHLAALRGESCAYEMEWQGRVFQTHIDPLRDANGRIIGCIGIAIDITDLKRTEEGLRTSEEKFKTLAEQSIVGTCIIQDGRFVYVNPRLAEILDFKPEEMTGLMVLDLVTEADRGMVKENMRRRFAGEVTCLHYTFRALKKGGAEVPFEVYGCLMNHLGRPAILGTLLDISERKRTEEALRTSRDYAGNMIESSIDMIIAVDQDRNITEFNQAAQKTFGYSAEEVMGKHIDLLYADPQEGVKVHHTTIEKGRCIVEVRNKSKAGKIFTSFLSASVLRDSRGDIMGVMGVSRDITDLKKAEGALLQMAAIVESSNEAIISLDLQDRVLTWNHGAERIFGYTAEEMTGRTSEHITPPELREERNLSLDMVRQGRRIDLQRTVRIRKDGKRLDISRSLSPIRDANGKVTGISFIARDITEIKKTESDRILLAVAVEHASESIIITNAQGAIEYVNKAFVDVSGYSRADVAGKNLRAVQGQMQDAAFHESLWQTLQKGDVWKGSIASKRPDGREYVEEASISPVRDLDGSIIHFVGVKRDVTREHNLEEQFRQSQKMEAIGQLAGSIAHDFNNLIGVILGYTDLILRKLPDDNPMRGKIESIRGASQKATHLTKQLLSFSRRQQMQPKVIDLNANLQGLTDMLRQVVGENIELTILLPRSASPVEVDPNHLDQALVNLAVNARDAMPNGGKLILEVNRLWFKASDGLQRAGIAPGEYILLSVKDTGTGMTPEIRSRIFEPFFTTKARGKGTGLGLSTSYGIIKQSGGHIEVQSAPGRGSVFTIYLPCTSKPIEAAIQPSEASPVSAGTETILVVEDEEPLREMAKEIFTGQGYHVLTAPSGREALALLQGKPQTIHLLFTDVVMPGMTGIELAERFRVLSPNTKVLFTSGYAEQTPLKGKENDSTVGFISKPYDLGSLYRKVRDLLKSPATQV